MKLMIEDLKDLIDWRTRMTVLVPLPIGQLKKKEKKRRVPLRSELVKQIDRCTYKGRCMNNKNRCDRVRSDQFSFEIWC